MTLPQTTPQNGGNGAIVVLGCGPNRTPLLSDVAGAVRAQSVCRTGQGVLCVLPVRRIQAGIYRPAKNVN